MESSSDDSFMWTSATSHSDSNSTELITSEDMNHKIKKMYEEDCDYSDDKFYKKKLQKLLKKQNEIGDIKNETIKHFGAFSNSDEKCQVNKTIKHEIETDNEDINQATSCDKSKVIAIKYETPEIPSEEIEKYNNFTNDSMEIETKVKKKKIKKENFANDSKEKEVLNCLTNYVSLNDTGESGYNPKPHHKKDKGNKSKNHHDDTFANSSVEQSCYEENYSKAKKKKRKSLESNNKELESVQLELRIKASNKEIHSEEIERYNNFTNDSIEMETKVKKKKIKKEKVSNGSEEKEVLNCSANYDNFNDISESEYNQTSQHKKDKGNKSKFQPDDTFANSSVGQSCYEENYSKIKKNKLKSLESNNMELESVEFGSKTKASKVSHKKLICNDNFSSPSKTIDNEQLMNSTQSSENCEKLKTARLADLIKFESDRSSDLELSSIKSAENISMIENVQSETKIKAKNKVSKNKLIYNDDILSPSNTVNNEQSMNSTKSSKNCEESKTARVTDLVKFESDRSLDLEVNSIKSAENASIMAKFIKQYSELEPLPATRQPLISSDDDVWFVHAPYHFNLDSAKGKTVTLDMNRTTKIKMDAGVFDVNYEEGERLLTMLNINNQGQHSCDLLKVKGIVNIRGHVPRVRPVSPSTFVETIIERPPIPTNSHRTPSPLPPVIQRRLDRATRRRLKAAEQ